MAITNKKTRVLGINLQHDAGCCLLTDGKIEFAISEERLSGRKGARGALYAVDYCLGASGATLDEIDLVVFSSYGQPIPPGFHGGLATFGLSPRRCVSVNHHLSHACSAFFISPFERALIVVADATGNLKETESYYIGEGNRITRIGGNPDRPIHGGIGRTFEAFTSFLGWASRDSGHTMALAALGDPNAYKGIDLFDIRGVEVTGRLPRLYAQGVLDFSSRIGIDFGTPLDRGRTQKGRNVARFVQDQLEQALVRIVGELIRQTGIRSVCFAGGIALNCAANGKLLREAGVEELFVAPAANDKGQCLGNALYGYHTLLAEPRSPGGYSDYHGRCYPDHEIEEILRRRPELGQNYLPASPEIAYDRPLNITDQVASLLASGETVAWCEGGSEFALRGLGHRSILADPRRLEVVEYLNRRVKVREPFRPYAPSVLAEDAARYFECSGELPFMTIAVPARPERRAEIPGVVHVDGTSRVQTVAQTSDSRFRSLIEAFYAKTGTPVLLNTSFNLSGEPLVETPRDALSAFLRSGLHRLVLGPFLVSKSGGIANSK